MKINITLLFIALFAFCASAQTMITGTQNFTHCYEDGEYSTLVYQSTNGNGLQIQFNGGELEEDYDFITIYDGDESGNVLLDEYSGDLTGLSFTALSGVLTILIDPDYSNSCAEGDFSSLAYTISLTNCAFPVFTLTSVPNCLTASSNDASVILNVSSMSGNNSFTVTTGSQTQTITSTGNYTFSGLLKNAISNFGFNVTTTCGTYTQTKSVFISCRDCEFAETLQVGNSSSQFRVIGDNTTGLINTDDTFCGGDYGIWYKLTVPQAITSLSIGQFESSDNEALPDGYLSVYRGTCNNLVVLECEDDVDYQEDYLFFPIFDLENLVPGETLYIFASGYSDDIGIFEIAAWNTTLSNDNFNLNNVIKLYPNPVNDILTLATDLEINSISVYNLLGQQVLNNKSFKEVNVSSLPQGNYIIKAQTEKGIYTSKFIKK